MLMSHFEQSKENDTEVKIIDFGFSRRVHTPQSLTSRCGTVSSSIKVHRLVMISN